MIEATIGYLLLVAVLWPLLLALPAVHKHMPLPRHLGIAPAAIAVLLPGEINLDLSWLLAGSELSLSSDVRWILLASVAIWIVAAMLVSAEDNESNSNTSPTLFLLTMAGNLGAILSTDLVSFFSFSTVMGYGFCAMLFEDKDISLSRAARLYLLCLVIADLALFEAMIVATFSSNSLTYDVVQMAILDNESAAFYVVMVFLAFALRAGAFPFHFWLTSVYNTAPLSKIILLGSVPIATGLVGALRLTVIGEQNLPAAGTVFMVLGGVAILYSLYKLYSEIYSKLLPAWLAVTVLGGFIAASGYGLANQGTWLQYQHLGYPLIAVFTIVLALSCYISRKQARVETAGIAITRLETATEKARQLTLNLGLLAADLQAMLYAGSTAIVNRASMIGNAIHWRQLDGILSGWHARTLMLVLLGLAMTWLAV